MTDSIESILWGITCIILSAAALVLITGITLDICDANITITIIQEELK